MTCLSFHGGALQILSAVHNKTFGLTSLLTKAILISGGWDGVGLSYVEAFHPLLDLSNCSLPDMPRGRRYHIMSKWTVCGGDGGMDTCITLSDTGTWNTSHKLKVERYGHVHWQVNARSALLLGRDVCSCGNKKSTEKIIEDVTQYQAGPFSLKYDTA